MKILKFPVFLWMALAAVFSFAWASSPGNCVFSYGMSESVLSSVGLPAGLKKGGSPSDNVLRLKKAGFYSLSMENEVNALGNSIYFPLNSILKVGYSEESVPSLVFSRWEVPGYTLGGEPGYPQVPVKVELIEIPQGARPIVKIKSQEYKDISLADLGVEGVLYPVQHPVSKGRKGAMPFSMQEDAYSLDVFLGDQAAYQMQGGLHQLVRVEELGQMRSQRLARLVVSPYLYNPVQKKLRVYTKIEFEVFFADADMSATRQVYDRYSSVAYSRMEKAVLNPFSVLGADAAKGVLRSAQIQRPLRYVIVSDPVFKDSLQKFIDWKILLGFDVEAVYTDNPEVGDSKESIHAWLKSQYDAASEEKPAPDYVLFVGDIGQIPTGYYQGIGWGSSGHFSDLYLCEFTGDHLPDVFYGRMSAQTVAELMPQIDKVMYMEGLRPERSSFLDTCVVIAGVDDNFGKTHLNPTIDYIYSNYMEDTLSRHGYKYPYPASHNKANDIVQNINDGVSVVIYTAHGHNESWSDPYIDNNMVDKNFSNKDKYPLMVGNCCLTGKFDVDKCFGEALLRKKDGGAAVYIGASNSTYFDQDVYWAIGYTSYLMEDHVHTYENTTYGAYDAMYHTHAEPFEDWAMSASEIVYAGNMAVEKAAQGLEAYYWQVYHVFGDPSYIPYTHKPEELSVNHPGEIYVGETQYRVYTEPYARVSLSQEGKVLGSVLADESGLAEVDLVDWSADAEMSLSVVLQNRITYIGKVDVMELEGKAVIPVAQSVFDMDGSPVGSLSYGSSYKFRYTLKNVGKESVNKMKLVFGQGNGLVFKELEYEVTEPVATGEELVLEHDFEAEVDANVADKSLVKYEMQVLCDGESAAQISKEWSVPAMAPSVRVVGFVINDSLSSVVPTNGVLDNGETVKAQVSFRNEGSVAAQSLSVRLSSGAGDWLVLPEDAFDLGTLEPGKEKVLEFTYSAKDAGVRYQMYDIIFNMTSMSREMSDTVVSYISPIIETFESGDFQFVDWQTDGSWKIAQDRVHSGSFSVSSPDVPENSSEYVLKLEVDASMEDVVEFYYNTSTELINGRFGDFLEFYIDGVLKGRWAGDDEQWRKVSFPVQEGKHTFEWKYVKDDTDKQGEDKVWLDDIRLPIGSKPAEVLAVQPLSGTTGSALKLDVVTQGDQLQLKVDSDKSRKVRFYMMGVDGHIKTVLHQGIMVDAGISYLSFPMEKVPSAAYLLVAESADGARAVVKFIKVI